MGSCESHENYGYRIYSLVENAPLHLAGLKELEDFIVPEKGNYEVTLQQYIDKHKDNLEMTIYNLRSKTFNKITVDINNKPYLGAVVNYENYITANTQLLHVLKVKFNTPAEKIGLVSDDDYIIAVKDRLDEIHSLNNELDPLSVFSKYVETGCYLYVYNRYTGMKILKCDYITLGCEAVFGPGHEFPDINRKLSRSLSCYSDYMNLTNEN